MILKSLKKIEEEQAELSLKASLFRAELDALKNIPTDIIAIQVSQNYHIFEMRFLYFDSIFLFSVYLRLQSFSVFSPSKILLLAFPLSSLLPSRLILILVSDFTDMLHYFHHCNQSAVDIFCRLSISISNVKVFYINSDEK